MAMRLNCKFLQFSFLKKKGNVLINSEKLIQALQAGTDKVVMKITFEHN